jgi:hypothetical protein
LKVPFWNEIAQQIETDLGTTFTGVQVRDKFKGMIKDCKVSKILVNKKIIRFILIIFTKKYNNFDFFSYLRSMLTGSLVEDGRT